MRRVIVVSKKDLKPWNSAIGRDVFMHEDGYPEGAVLSMFRGIEALEVYNAAIFAYHIEDLKYYFYKDRTNSPGLRDLSQSTLFNKVSNLNYISDGRLVGDFYYSYKVTDSIRVAVNLYSNKAIFYIGNRPHSFEAFISNVPVKVAKPFIFDMDFWKETT